MEQEHAEYISVGTMARELAVPERTILTALRQGHLRGFQPNRRVGWRVTRQDFAAWKRSLYNQEVSTR